MALASKYLAVSQPDHAPATTPRGTCTATGGLDAETFRGFQLAGKLFLLTSFFIEPKGCRFESYLRSQIPKSRVPTTVKPGSMLRQSAENDAAYVDVAAAFRGGCGLAMTSSSSAMASRLD
jgi:hypothetical protein